MSQPSILLSGFADEAANQKTLDQQFYAFAALGIDEVGVEFFDFVCGDSDVESGFTGQVGAVDDYGDVVDGG